MKIENCDFDFQGELVLSKQDVAIFMIDAPSDVVIRNLELWFIPEKFWIQLAMLYRVWRWMRSPVVRETESTHAS
jgi:hypothetical protein